MIYVLLIPFILSRHITIHPVYSQDILADPVLQAISTDNDKVVFAFVQESLIPSVIKYISRHLKIKTPDSLKNIQLKRTCQKDPLNPTTPSSRIDGYISVNDDVANCILSSESDLKCGPYATPSDEHFSDEDFYYIDNIDFVNNFTKEGGYGIPQSDIVIYIDVVEDSIACSKYENQVLIDGGVIRSDETNRLSVISGVCARSSELADYGRPTAGYISICKSSINTRLDYWESAVTRVLHEFLKIILFHSETAQYLPNVFKSRNDFTNQDRFITNSSLILDLVGDHYNCSTPTYIPFLQVNGGYMDDGLLWDPRVLRNDLMSDYVNSVDLSYGPRYISPITIGFIRDSPWYDWDEVDSSLLSMIEANSVVIDPPTLNVYSFFPWGKDTGCVFYERAVSGVDCPINIYHTCVINDPLTKCTVDSIAMATCVFSIFSPYDICPRWAPTEQGQLCWDTGNLINTDQSDQSIYYGPDSICTVVNDIGQCRRSRCASTKRLDILDQGFWWICDEEHATIKRSFQFSLECPLNVDFLCRGGSTCLNNGFLTGVNFLQNQSNYYPSCECPTGFFGHTCNVVDNVVFQEQLGIWKLWQSELLGRLFIKKSPINAPYILHYKGNCRDVRLCFNKTIDYSLNISVFSNDLLYIYIKWKNLTELPDGYELLSLSNNSEYFKIHLPISAYSHRNDELVESWIRQHLNFLLFYPPIIYHGSSNLSTSNFSVIFSISTFGNIYSRGSMSEPFESILIFNFLSDSSSITHYSGHVGSSEFPTSRPGWQIIDEGIFVIELNKNYSMSTSYSEYLMNLTFFENCLSFPYVQEGICLNSQNDTEKNLTENILKNAFIEIFISSRNYCLKHSCSLLNSHLNIDGLYEFYYISSINSYSFEMKIHRRSPSDKYPLLYPAIFPLWHIINETSNMIYRIVDVSRYGLIYLENTSINTSYYSPHLIKRLNPIYIKSAIAMIPKTSPIISSDGESISILLISLVSGGGLLLIGIISFIFYKFILPKRQNIEIEKKPSDYELPTDEDLLDFLRQSQRIPTPASSTDSRECEFMTFPEWDEEDNKAPFCSYENLRFPSVLQHRGEVMEEEEETCRFPHDFSESFSV